MNSAYNVHKDDTLSDIANRPRLFLVQLKAASLVEDALGIRLGQRFSIPLGHNNTPRSITHKPDHEPDHNSDRSSDLKPNHMTSPEPAHEPSHHPDQHPDYQLDQEQDHKPDPKPNHKPDHEPDPKSDPKSDHVPDPKPDHISGSTSSHNPEDKPGHKPDHEVDDKSNQEPNDKPEPDPKVPSIEGGSENGGPFVSYSGPAKDFPLQSQWAIFTELWATNAALMKLHNSDGEIAQIKTALTNVSTTSGVDIRVILCVIMQESGGNVRVASTNNGVHNPGLMQSHNGVSFDPNEPAESILQMVRDGTEGTASGDGLEQLEKKYHNWYEALRVYNSGSVDQQDLSNGFGATPGYVSGVTNRLMGHVWQGM